MKTRMLRSAVVLAVAGLALTGCATAASSPGSSPDAGATGGGKVQIVASTNVYGDIAQAIAGDAADVVSVMSDPAQDPHSFEANAQTQLAISKADVLIENGGGYDDFMDKLRESAKNDTVAVVNAVQVSGKQPDEHGELNEHVWYDLPTVQKVAAEIATTLGKADPAHADQFTRNAADFSAKLDTIITREGELKAQDAGKGVAITEPVPGYMLDAIGLDDKTPDAFSHAVEQGDDVPPAVLQETLALFPAHAVDLLVLNAQTADAQSKQVEDAAAQAGIPVVKVTETLPSGKNYPTWMSENLESIAQALGKQ